MICQRLPCFMLQLSVGKKYLIDLLCVNHKTTRSIAKKSGDKKRFSLNMIGKIDIMTSNYFRLLNQTR